MKLKKLINAIISAINYLENSKESLMRGDEESVRSYVWRASADSEYALFLFSLMHRKELEDSSWKTNFRMEKGEIRPTLAFAQDLLKEAKESIKANDYNKAHKKTWIARGCLLKIQHVFEKRPLP